jgi:hypothetical protein
MLTKIPVDVMHFDWWSNAAKRDDKRFKNIDYQLTEIHNHSRCNLFVHFQINKLNSRLTKRIHDGRKNKNKIDSRKYTNENDNINTCMAEIVQREKKLTGEDTRL